MNKGELLTAVYDRLDLTKHQVHSVATAVFDVIQESVVAGQTVTLTGFGKFTPRVRAARTARNPLKPAEVVNVPSRRGVSFKAGKSLKTALNS